MSFGREYTKYEVVMVDQGVWNPLPTLGPCTVEAQVLENSNAAQIELLVAPTDSEVGGAVHVSKDRVQP